MKLHEQATRPLNLVTGHGNGTVSVGDTVLRAPFVLGSGHLAQDWIAHPDALDAAALDGVWPLTPQILLLGTTPADPMRWRELRRLCAARGVALEVMDLGAACRTFNVLAQEDRAVVALLFP